MNKTYLSEKKLLFAYCITDGILDELYPEQRTAIIRAIESMFKDGDNILNKTK
jgi:hypothetical protein